jgi:hypothetical protein
MQRNSLLGCEEHLEKVPNQGRMLSGDNIFPESINNLVVAGNSVQPGNIQNPWSKECCKQLLAFMERKMILHLTMIEILREKVEGRKVLEVTRPQCNFETAIILKD